jgi:hypothetical protein
MYIKFLEDTKYFLREGMVVRLESPPEATEGEIDFPNTSL